MPQLYLAHLLDLKPYEGTLTKCLSECRKDGRTPASLSTILAARVERNKEDEVWQDCFVSNGILYAPNDRIYIIPPNYNPVFKKPNRTSKEINMGRKGLWLSPKEFKRIRLNSYLFREVSESNEGSYSVLTEFPDEELLKDIFGDFPGNINYMLDLRIQNIDELCFNFTEKSDYVPYSRAITFRKGEITDEPDVTEKGRLWGL